MSDDAIIQFTLRLTVAGDPVALDITLPDRPLRAREMVRVFQALTDVFVSAAEKQVQQEGKKISCCVGCGACCRQVVPLTPEEAWWLADYVAQLPAERRAAIEARFAEVRRRLEEAGLLDDLRHPQRLDEKQVETWGRRYFALQIACPFLEDESCSIHKDRPMVCREFLVTSPAAHCASLEGECIERVPLPAKVSTAVALLGADRPMPMRPWVPLTLALEWAAQHEDSCTPRAAQEILQELFNRLGGKPG